MHHVPENTYKNRRNAGYSHDEAVAYPSRVRYQDKIELPDGRWFPNLTEMARATGINATTLEYRRAQGYTGADLITPDRHKPAARARVIQGIPFASDKDAAAHFGVTYNTYLRRLADDWSVEQALGLTPSPKALSLTIDGVPYPSIRALAAAFNQNRDIVRIRLSAGASPRQAVGLDTFTHPHENADTLRVDGVPYTSIAELAKAYDKPYTTVLRRIQAGMDPKAAVTKPVRRYKRKR